MDPIHIIRKYYKEGTPLYERLLSHSEDVAQKALHLARNRPQLNIDLDFVYEAAMLHDIGIYLTDAPDIHCYGEEPYICHGYLGNSLLQHEGFPQHGLVCERHTGMGFDVRYIIEEELPIPQRNMLPVSVEEQIICFADKFFSKSKPGEERTVEKIRNGMMKYGNIPVERFDYYCTLFL